jgi:molecular chaperone GrpE
MQALLVLRRKNTGKKQEHSMSEKHAKDESMSREVPGEPDETASVSSDAGSQSATAIDSSAGLTELQDQLDAARAKAAENLDGWQRALAEFQNYRKRIERDREADQAIMKAELIHKFLPVVDDLERALKNRPAEDAWTNGIELILRKVQSILEAEGVARIEAEGQTFDPNFHEAVSQEPVDGAESGSVVAVLQNGYMLGDKVIRPAQVRVAK